MAAAGVCMATVAQGQPAAPKPAAKAPSESDQKAARDYFRKGLKLFKDRNYSGALASFEASYAAKPSPATLLNIALAQKEMFRYSEAADTLRKLLRQHAAEISSEEKREYQRAIEELEGLVGSVELTVVPNDARVTVNGRVLGQKDRDKLRLDVGEHVFTAEAPGYTRVTKKVSVAGGGGPVPIRLELKATKGFIAVTSGDPQAAIAIDGNAVAFHTWKGPVEPGRHYVQVYKKGFQPFEQVVFVELGKTAQVKAKLGPPAELEDEDEDGEIVLDLPDPKNRKRKNLEQRGWYVLGAVSALSLDRNPAVFDQSGADVAGGSFGVRGGYRLWRPVAIEALAEVAANSVTASCNPDGQTDTCPENTDRDFALFSARAGLNLRILSGGDKLRFSGAAGFGAVNQRLEVDRTEVEDGEALPKSTAQGVDPYFMIEAGAQYNAGNILLELSVVTYFNSTSNLSSDDDAFGDDEPIFRNDGLITAGIGFRMGWSQWAP